MKKSRFQPWAQKLRQFYLEGKKNKREYLLLFILILSANFLIGWNIHDALQSSEFYLSDGRYRFWAPKADFSQSEVSMVFFNYEQKSGESRQDRIYIKLTEFLRKLISLSLEKRPRALVFDIGTDKLQLEKQKTEDSVDEELIGTDEPQLEKQKTEDSVDKELINSIHMFSQISPTTLGYGTDTSTHIWLDTLKEDSEGELPQLGDAHGINYKNNSKIRFLYLRDPEQPESISLAAVTLEAIAQRENKQWPERIEQLPKRWRKVWSGKNPFPIRPPLPPLGERFFLPVIQADEFLESESSEQFLEKIHNKVLVLAVDDPRGGDKIQLIHQDNLELLPGGIVHGLVIDSWLKILENKTEPLSALPTSFFWYELVIAITIAAFLLGFLPRNAFSFLVILLVTFVLWFSTGFFLAHMAIAWELPVFAPTIYFLVGYSCISANKKWKLHQISPVAIAITTAKNRAMSQEEITYIKKIAKLYGGNSYETTRQVVLDFPLGFYKRSVELVALEVAAEIQGQLPRLKIGVGWEKNSRDIQVQQTKTSFMNWRLFIKSMLTSPQNPFHIVDRSEEVRELAEKASEGKVLVSAKLKGYVPDFLLEEEFIDDRDSCGRFYRVRDSSILLCQRAS